VEGSNHREERDLQLAREIQRGHLPAQPLVAGPWEVHGTLLPSPKMGGAFLDYYPAGQRRFALALGEVSGWGVGAALRLSNAQAMLRAFCDGGRGLSEGISRVNHHLTELQQPGHFVTLFFAEIDHEREMLTYVNAGHPFPLLRHADGRVEWLEESQLLLGIVEEARFEETRVPLHPGDALLVYSSEVFDAEKGATGIRFGEERLLGFWKERGALPADEILRDLVRAVSEFRGDGPQSGDFAALVVTSRDA